MSPASPKKTKKRIRCRRSRGPRCWLCQSSSPPPPPPPVGRRSTGGFPPIPGSFRSISAGARVKVTGIRGLCACRERLLPPWFGRTRKCQRWPIYAQELIWRKKGAIGQSEWCLTGPRTGSDHDVDEELDARGGHARVRDETWPPAHVPGAPGRGILRDGPGLRRSAPVAVMRGARMKTISSGPPGSVVGSVRMVESIWRP